MKIAIIGAGAMGSLYGGLLAEGGQEVLLVDVWQEHVDTINQWGLSMEGVNGHRTIKNIKATTNPSYAEAMDLVIVFVKSTITHIAVSQHKKLCDNNTTVLTLQNGLGNIEKIMETIDKKNIIAGTTAQGCTLLAPGKINHAGVGDTYIGELDGTTSPRIKEIHKAFTAGGLKTNISNNVLGLIWGKLLVNVGINALTAITNLRNGQLVEFEETEELLELAVEEALAVAMARGIELPYGDPVAHTKKICRATALNKSSMLQDLLNKRKTEIAMINGAVVTEGEKLGVKTPVNKVLTNLITVLEKNQ
ncbi:ketopantoate reductase family protein [Natronincola ferrireducens]|uniref:2-dehydropantoate 2-reductase n=1 Tax=Natronincola ferrireducens TaxID=393762 RepID=A0A1G9FEF6_9FIRM|nr:ketopantoate reductase family protein [Natronincola ferrireducens]SDK86732.1 ketopantoate reductase [Natronincola ferrireducens]